MFFNIIIFAKEIKLFIDMTVKDFKSYSAIITAVLSFLVGCFLAIYSCVTSPTADIANGTLYGIAQFLTYAGAIFGVAWYIKDEIAKQLAKLGKRS